LIGDKGLALKKLFHDTFVRTSKNNFGIGKVFDLETNKVTIEYFDSPALNEQPTKTVPKSSVIPVQLYSQTRVYYFDSEESFWRAGRVLDSVGSDYLIQFPNKLKLSLKEEELYVRWNRPIVDPTALLENRINETPFFNAGRSKFVRSIIHQRKASAGMTGLLSSSIELEAYQIEVVKRVLTDPIQRYLLADEVGLGKTIEAGVIIRQNVLDRPNTHNILIVVPKHIVGQWREELCEKFHLDEYLDESIIVVPSNNIVSIKEFGAEANMLVIDEAHHIASFVESKNEEERNLFDLIRNISNNTEKLLLLSATPVLHNEMGFLAMLHLLDPAIYKLEGIESFRERVNKRQEIAEIYHNFNKESSGYFLKDYSTELQEYFPQDNRLRELLGRLEPLLEFGISEDNPQRMRLIHSVRSHISETYKLHRRLLRNRRTEDKEDLVTGRSGLISVTFSETIYNEIEELIDEWRIESSLSNVDNPNKELIELFQIIFEAFISDFNLLSTILLLRLGKLESYVNNTQFHEIDLSIVTNTPLFESEEGILNKILSLIVSNPSVDEHRLTALTNLLKEKINESKRIVIFCNFQSTADNLFNNLSQKFSKKTIVRHSTYIDSSSKYKSDWRRFKNDPECRILVCDRRGEEGLNLQGGHAIIIHYDIPISPNRLEQRMGRLDRYGYGDAVKSYLLIFKDSHLISSWITLLNEVFQVFDRSIASLQYLIEDEMKKLWKDFLFDGSDAIKEKIQEFGGDEGKIVSLT